MQGTIPSSLWGSDIVGIRTTGTSLSCTDETETFTNYQNHAAGNIDALSPACRAVVRRAEEMPNAIDNTIRFQSITVHSKHAITCDMYTLPGTVAPLSLEYMRAVGCTCPARTRLRLTPTDGAMTNSFVGICIEVEWLWIAEMGFLSFLLGVFLCFRCATFVGARKARLLELYMNVCKEQYMPGTLRLAWNEADDPKSTQVMRKRKGGFASSLASLVLQMVTCGRAERQYYRACWIMCKAQDLDVLYDALTEDQVAHALAVYNHICCEHLGDLHGYPVREDEDGCLVFAFHTVTDGLAWALITQNVLLQGHWPAYLSSVPQTEPLSIVVDEPGYEPVAQLVFSGLRIAMAVMSAVPERMSVARSTRGGSKARSPLPRCMLVPYVTSMLQYLLRQCCVDAVQNALLEGRHHNPWSFCAVC